MRNRYSYAETFAEADRTFCLVAVMAALGSFFVLFCACGQRFDFSSLGAVSMFGAILCSIAATALFPRAFNRYLPACFRSYSGAGTDAQFQVSVSLIAPLAFCLMFFTLFSVGSAAVRGGKYQ